MILTQGHLTDTFGPVFSGMLINKFVPNSGWGKTNEIENIKNTETPSVPCFEAGTLILTENGYKKIEEIKVGDLVYSYNEILKIPELKKVTRTFINETEEIYNLKIGMEILKATENHPFYLRDIGWVSVKNLKIGDEILLYNEQVEKVIEISKEEKNIHVYNFEVEDNHSYYVGISSFLVHNDCGQKVNNNALTPEQVKLDNFTQKGGKIQEFADGIKGQSYDELEKLFDEELVKKLNYVKEPLRSGDGVRYLQQNGKAILLERGRPNFQDITHRGDYVKIPGTNLGTLRIPLKGNPSLK